MQVSFPAGHTRKATDQCFSLFLTDQTKTYSQVRIKKKKKRHRGSLLDAPEKILLRATEWFEQITFFIHLFLSA